MDDDDGYYFGCHAYLAWLWSRVRAIRDIIYTEE